MFVVPTDLRGSRAKPFHSAPNVWEIVASLASRSSSVGLAMDHRNRMILVRFAIYFRGKPFSITPSDLCGAEWLPRRRSVTSSGIGRCLV